MNHLERTSFDQNMRAPSEVALLLLLVVGRPFELQDEKITENQQRERVYATYMQLLDQAVKREKFRKFILLRETQSNSMI